MRKERQKKAKLLIWHFKHVDQDAPIQNMKKKYYSGSYLYTIAPVLTSRESIQPLTTEESLHLQIKSQRSSKL